MIEAHRVADIFAKSIALKQRHLNLNINYSASDGRMASAAQIAQAGIPVNFKTLNPNLP